ncbi:WD40 repeat domain-containing protein [Phormidium sp. CLA17]|uniref:WD40 repeat domain-containing protein n=1 Tax=Leptolyngbya sp. Cla-17 TaxID=2803751 RepID=UPI0014909B92|nr:WD40 repeat domain-containing protein [Leptolyngbya sp. Cla-17]MBM0743645.1 WD40 repeat domain-containing protein [Leptolyngbya sp. Cla-17]
MTTKAQEEFQLRWQGSLADYVTAIAWSPNGLVLSASSAAGEIILLSPETQNLTLLEADNGQSIDCLAISPDSKFLAASGQNGQVKLWQLSDSPTLITTLENKPVWVDRLAWNPKANQLAFSLGRYVQVWDATANEVITTLNFEASSVMDLAWHPKGQFLAACGNQGARVWNAKDWDAEPEVLEIPSASVAIAWSPDGKYIADGNLDNTLSVMEWGQPNPWVMQGFPGKVRQLTWSQTSAPLLASCSSETVVAWQRSPDESVGWASQVLEAHEGVVRAIAFQPKTTLLASAAEDGLLCLWQHAQQVVQVLEGAPNGFSCMAWHPQGHQLAAGGKDGELLLWSKASRGQGFRKRL